MLYFLRTVSPSYKCNKFSKSSESLFKNSRHTQVALMFIREKHSATPVNVVWYFTRLV